MDQSSYAPFIKPLLTEAYQAQGHQVVFRSYPAKRSLYSANSGKTDGDLVRVKRTDQQYPNLVPIPVAISTTRIVAATIRKDLAITDWQSMQNMAVGILNGQVLTERFATGSPVIPYNDYEDLYQAGNSGKVSLIVLPEINALKIIKRKGDQNRLQILPTALAEVDLFHMVHLKHRALIDALTHQFHIMQKNGRIAWHNENGRKLLINHTSQSAEE